jgi:DNA polymerase-1
MLRGVRIDAKRRSEVAGELMEAISVRESLIHQIAGEPLNVGSPKQMKEFFYDSLNLTPILHKKTKKPTLDDNALTKLAEKNPLLHPLVSLISEKRSLGVFLSTFCLMPLDSDGRMRTSYNIAGTETFRFNSGENAFGNGGNLQNIPKGEEA